MNKKTQTIIGVVAVGAIAYYFWNKNKSKTFANLTAPPKPRCGQMCVNNSCYGSDNQWHVCSGTKYIQSFPKI